MPDIRNILKVFLASPGDLAPERQLARKVVNETNQLVSDMFGCQIELIGWEDTHSVFGRPQATINQELEKCECVIGMMWKKWGTAPALDAKYSSGFEEEFRTSVARRLATGRPEISMFFKEIEEEYVRDPGEQLKKVLEFKQELINGKSLLFESFSDAAEFEEKFRRCIFGHLRKAAESGGHSSAESAQSPKSEVPTESLDNSLLSPTAIATAVTNGTDLLNDLFNRADELAGYSELSETQIARFRLLSTIINRPANDELVLGAHDANLLFAERRNINFSYQELLGLVACGLSNYKDQNVPIWHWLAATNQNLTNFLVLSSMNGSTRNRSAALSIMTLLSVRLSDNAPLKKPALFSSLLSANVNSSLKVAALRYLGQVGDDSDVEYVKAELARSDSMTAETAAAALIEIGLKDSRESAIKLLYELRPATLSPKLIKRIFSEEIGDDKLLEGITQPAAAVRRAASTLLWKRGTLSVDVAETLLADSDSEVVYVALRTLVQSGRVFTYEEAKRHLAKTSSSATLLGIGGGNADANRFLEIFKTDMMKQKSSETLSGERSHESVFSQDVLFILAERAFKREGEVIRGILRDSAESFFNAGVDKLKSQYGAEHKLISQAYSLSDFLRRNFVQKAVGIVCRKGNSSDLSLVRRVVERQGSKYVWDIGAFFGRFGEFKDVELLLKLLETLPNYDSDLDLEHLAAVLLKLGRHRLSKLILMPMPERLFVRVVIACPESHFAKLSDDVFLTLLRSTAEMNRKIVALKMVRSLSKSKIVAILDPYVLHEETYYNAVHWLDLGASFSRHVARGAAGIAMAECL